MARSSGLTLVELLIVTVVVTALVGLLLPSMAATRERARLIACAAQLRAVHNGLMAYAAMNERRLPPFAFSDYLQPSLPLAGHWGGHSQSGASALFGRVFERRGVAQDVSVNLWSLVGDGLISPDRLICPSAPPELRSGDASYFPYTSKFSTYCLRFPYSKDLFREAPELESWGGGLLGVYLFVGGGKWMVGQYHLNAPLVRTDRRYRIAAPAACGDGVYNVASDVMLSDSFWQQELSVEAPAAKADQKSYPVRRGWRHGRRFNALEGNGAVRTVTDSKDTIRDNSNSPARTLGNVGYYHATYAERIWQFLDKPDAAK